MHRASHRRRRLVLIATIGAVGLALLFCRLFAPAEFLRDPQAVLIDWAAHWGWPAVFVYLAGFIVLGTVGVPPALFIVPLGLLWPRVVAFPMALAGGVGAALTGFLLSRYIARGLLSLHIPKRLQHYEEQLEEHGFSTVIMLRLLFFLFPPINWLLGVSDISLRTYVTATVLGSLPGTLFLTFTGSGMIPWVLGQSPLVIVSSVIAFALVVILWLRFIMTHPAHRRPPGS